MRNSMLLVLACCLPLHAAEKDTRPTNVVELFGGQENLDIIRGADRVEACVLTYEKPNISEDEYEKLSVEEQRALPLRIYRESYREGEYRVIPPEILNLVRTALLDDGTYIWNRSKGCFPRYHNRLRFTKNDKRVTVDLCFSCEVLLILRNDVPVGGEDFDHDGGELLRSMKSLFPEDSTLVKIRK